MNDDSNMHTPTTTDAAVDTGAAIATAGAFGMFGAIIGRAIGALGNTNQHSINGKLGAWIGGATFAILSLYANFKSRRQHERTEKELRQENQMLRAELRGMQTPEPVPAKHDEMMPPAAVSAIAHLGVAYEAASEKML